MTGSELGKSIGAGESGVDWPDDGVLNTGDVSGDSSNLNAWYSADHTYACSFASMA